MTMAMRISYLTRARPALLLMALTLAALLGGCGILGKEYDETEGWTAAEIYNKAARELDSANYKRAIELYQKLETRYPFGRYAMQGQLDVAYAHYRAEQPEAALAAADRFIKLYPQNPYVDYAYYLKGVVNYNRSVGFLDRFVPIDTSQRDPGSALDAFEDFAELVRRFPDSKYAEDARQRMLYLRSNLAKNEVHVARYYMERGAYIAAANRAQYVIERYQRTSAVEDALEILVDAYEQLGKDQLAADAQRVLTMEFAESIPPGEATSAAYPQDLKDQWGVALFEFTLRGFFEHRFLHADPNFANFGFREDGSVVVYDYGCMKEVPGEIAAGYARLIDALLKRRKTAFPALLKELGVYKDSGAMLPRSTTDPYVELMQDMVRASPAYTFGSDDTIYKTIYDLGMANWKEANDIRFPRDMVFIDRTLGGLFGNLGKLGATGPWRQLLRQYTAPLV